MQGGCKHGPSSFPGGSAKSKPPNSCSAPTSSDCSACGAGPLTDDCVSSANVHDGEHQESRAIGSGSYSLLNIGLSNCPKHVPPREKSVWLCGKWIGSGVKVQLKSSLEVRDVALISSRCAPSGPRHQARDMPKSWCLSHLSGGWKPWCHWTKLKNT